MLSLPLYNISDSSYGKLLSVKKYEVEQARVAAQRWLMLPSRAGRVVRICHVSGSQRPDAYHVGEKTSPTRRFQIDYAPAPPNPPTPTSGGQVNHGMDPQGLGRLFTVRICQYSLEAPRAVRRDDRMVPNPPSRGGIPLAKEKRSSVR